MKIFIVFLLVCLSVVNASLLKNVATPTALVGINVTWAFTSAVNTTNVTVVVKRLDAGEWAAVGLGQHVAMVKMLTSRKISSIVVHIGWSSRIYM